jgi:hypothetical protein
MRVIAALNGHAAFVVNKRYQRVYLTRCLCGVQ